MSSSQQREKEIQKKITFPPVNAFGKRIAN